MKYLLLSLLILMGCNENGEQLPNARVQSGDIERWENDEVICYIYDGSYAGGLSCKWKPKDSPAHPHHDKG